MQALLVADHVYIDKITGKKVVAGIFHEIWFGKQVAKPEEEGGKVQIPIRPGGYSVGSPFCYISLTDVRGSQPFCLRYVDLSEEKVLFEVNFQVQCDNPLNIIEVVLPLPPLPVKTPGTFALELVWNDDPLGAYRINVRQKKEEENQNGN